MKLIWSDEAVTRFQEASEYLETNFSSQTAHNFEQRVFRPKNLCGNTQRRAALQKYQAFDIG